MTTTHSQHIRCNGISLHVVTAGPASGSPVILLHGFPDFWYGWRHQIDALAARGFRLIIPDQRGYGLSDKPRPVAAYDIHVLSADVVALMDALGLASASLVSHDFGGGVAWWVAANHPARVDRMVVLNCPHFSVYRDAHLGREQLARSWYVAGLAVPWVSERVCRLADFHALTWLGPGTRDGGMRNEDVADYRAAWAQPGAVHGMLAWYRAMIPALFRRFPRTQIAAPTRVVWGGRDRFLSRSMARPSIDHCQHGELVMLDQGHWLHWDVPDQVNPLIADWLAGAPTDGARARRS